MHTMYNILKKSLLLLAALPLLASATDYRTITRVEPVSVSSPVGTAPRLPYRLWVTYDDGTAEFRQVKWTNSSLVREQAEANPDINPVGTEYQVKGFILGDNTTPSGYPVTAQVTVVSEPWAVPAAPVAQTLPLDCVSIDGDNRLTHNRDLDIDNLLSLDVRQQLYNYRDTYGLSTDGYPEADGWDSPTTKLKGHGSGHYMSALAMAFASCQDTEKKARLRENIRLMVDELRACQERTFVWSDSLGRYWEARDFAPEAELRLMQGTWADFDRYKQDYSHYGYGYLNAIPAQHCVLIEMYRAYNNEAWVWAPYYSVHKQLAGLIDIATYIDDADIARKALLTAKDMGLWVWNRMHYRTFVSADGSQEERRARPGNRYEMWNMYIAGEVGGMAESLARLAEMTGTPEERDHLLEAATCFDSPAFFDPLAQNIDAIRTRHANQHIPMIVGALRTYRVGHNPYYYNLAQNFWTMIQGRYRYAMGGVGNGEMFRQPYSQITSMCMNVTSWGGRDLHPEPTINETCCAYNLAKLTKDLACFRPDDAAYMDYYERVLYNQLVGSVNPDEYMVLYQYAVGLGASKPWGNETPQSTCCGGTGAENHVKYQEAAYFVSTPEQVAEGLISPSSGGGRGEATLWVALYMPTTARWDAQGVTIRQQCQWPAEHSVITVTPSSGGGRGDGGLNSPSSGGGRGEAFFAMKLRVPYWATQGFSVTLNGQPVATTYQPGTYVEIPARQWTASDVVEVSMPFTAHLDFGPDKMEQAPAEGSGAPTDFAPMWAGTFMYGPLVMATTGIHSWEEATIDVSPRLADVSTFSPSSEGNKEALHTLQHQGRIFIPDYAADRDVTHYFRMNIPADPALAAASPSSVGGQGEAEIDRTALRELMLVARQRIDDQQAWLALPEPRVPEYAPWAPHAYQRMEEQYLRGEPLLAISPSSGGGKGDGGHISPSSGGGRGEALSQDEVDRAASSLNAIINSMRPGNLPELEDMERLMTLMEQARQLPEGDEALDRALGYAGMVVRYVSDGSGTFDMIERAERQLRECLK